jgi:superfamily I DNA and/or RNA helicase
MVKGRSIVLVGDHRQLPPLLNQEIEAELLNDAHLNGNGDDYRLTLFERLFNGLPPTRKEALRKQYRMVPPICEVVRRLSYQEKELAIETAGDALVRCHPFRGVGPIHWITCEGGRNVAEPVGYGIRNHAEVDAVLAFLSSRLLPTIESDEFPRYLKGKKNGDPYEIGIIAMYRQQALALEAALSRCKLPESRLTIEVGTVDAFQGREKDAVIVSFVETNPNKLRFFYDRKRLNVALSRARELLVLVGGLDVLGHRTTVPGGRTGSRNPLNELKFLLDGGVGASRATREVYRG